MPNNHSQHQAGLLERATEWYLRIRDPNVSEEQVAGWQGWLAQSQAHQRAFDKVTELMQLSCHVKTDLWPDEHELLADTYSGDVAVADWLRATTSPTNNNAKQRFTWRWPIMTWGLWAAAGTAALTVLAVGLALLMDWQGQQQAGMVYQTAAAEHRDVTLPDGSVLNIGAKSHVVVSYTAGLRRLRLERGEVYFDVARDPDRPFVVVAANAAIRAIGTAFNINRKKEYVAVAVTEGMVSVTPKPNAVEVNSENIDASTSLSTRLAAGHQLTVNTHDFSTVTTPINPQEALAWRAGYHKYRGEPISQVLEDVNRYRDRPILLSSETVGELRYSGTVFQNRIDAWLVGLETVFPVAVHKLPSGDIILYARENTSDK